MIKKELIYLLVRPNSKSTYVAGIVGKRIKIKIASSPEKGRANKALIDFISARTGIAKKNISIVSGLTSSLKEVEILKESDEDIASLLLQN